MVQDALPLPEADRDPAAAERSERDRADVTWHATVALLKLIRSHLRETLALADALQERLPKG